MRMTYEEAMADVQALLKLLTDKEARNKFGSALKAEVKKRFSFTKMLTDTLALYR